MEGVRTGPACAVVLNSNSKMLAGVPAPRRLRVRAAAAAAAANSGPYYNVSLSDYTLVVRWGLAPTPSAD